MPYPTIRADKQKILSSFAIILGIGLLLVSFGPLLIDELWYRIKTIKKQQYLYLGSSQNSDQDTLLAKDSVFARFLSTKSVELKPVNTSFSLLIEKIGINVPIIEGVSVSDPKSYAEALKYGVAHAEVSDLPTSEPSNVYLFAHSSLNFWELGKYATTFNLLRKLAINDDIYVFYEDEVFRYRVVNKEIFSGWNTYPLTRAVVEPILTLQTCDPPGTTLNRLVITAKLESVSKF